MLVEKTLKTNEELSFFETGTKDQRGYATDIRKAFLKEAAEYRANVAGKPMEAAYDKAVEAVAGNTDALWWIENKSQPMTALVMPELKKYL